MIVGFDLDGVITFVPTKNSKLMFVSYWLMVIPQFRIFYDKFIRRINPEIEKLIKYLIQKKVKIFIITGNTVGYQKDLEKWLKRHGLPYDRIFCYHSGYGLSRAEWKAKIIRENKVDYFFDDLFLFVEKIRKETEAKVIHYCGQTFEELKELIK
jgi:hydroxymethylpyrimidine pyrophosphatase-like HAD family hydrolase